MKKDNFLTYYSALMLWTMNIWYKCSRNIIGYPMLCFSVFLYKKSDYVKKHFEKLGFTSSKDLKNRYGDYVDSMDPYKDYFCDANMYSLCVFFVHSTILVISNCVFGFNPCFYFTIVLKSKSLALYSFVVVLLLAFVFEYYFISRKDKAKKLFKQFDKWKQPKRRRMQWLAFGLIVAICGYQVLTMWLFFVNYKLWM
ncbi:MAG: hypothetical protein J6R59_14810 [Paludibacteraceae bacterium]|nr:hypothetical protein [Paludibacteraceae bacterium]